MSSMKDIELLIASLSPTEIKAIMSEVKTNVRTSVDTSRKQRRIANTEAYFKATPKPHMCADFSDYVSHSDSIRQQIYSGVESWK
jgi:hypothetical protein